MNTWLYKELCKCFKSHSHLLRFIRLLGNRALYLNGFKKIIKHEEIVKGINAGKSDTEIACKLGITAKTVYRHRLILFKKKR